MISNDTGDYLAYTITVTAGQDGAKDVSIVDCFTSNSNLVSFVGITAEEKTITNEENSLNPFETIAEEKNHGSIYKGKVTTDNTIPSASDTSISEPGSLVWKIGDMSAGETRSLTYYVKLKESVNLYGKAINNNAKLFSQSYFRQEDNAGFTFNVDYTGRMTKRNETPVRQEDKSYRIPYTLNFSISKGNSNYSLKDFVFWDYLDYSDYYTNPTVRKYVNYDQDSVKLFVKKDGETEFSEVDSNNYTINWIYGDGGNNPTRFSVKGTEAHPIVVNPGDAYYVSYSLTVSYEAMAAMKSNSVQISNRFIVDASNAKKLASGTILDRVFNQATVGNYNWNEKNVGNATTTHQTIMMNGNVYDSSFNSESVESFVVPSGSYPYTVKVNQTLGDWDLTKVIMKDSLTPSDRMQYVGYLKIEACKYDDATNTYNTVDTKWVNIDGKSSFAIKPSDIGWNNNTYSYNITYYAKPINQEMFSHAIVKNSFTLEGSVTNGISGRPAYPITGIKSEKEVTVNGHYSMSVTKSSWYYEEPVVDSGNWQNGKMYWVVEVSGSSIKEGTVFKDIVLKGDGNNGKNSILHEDSIAGIYKGTLEEGKYISSYKTLNDLEEQSTLISVKDKFDILPLEKNTEINVKAKENIILTTDKLYIVVMSEPSQIPTNYREVYSYKNNIQTSDNGKDFIDRAIATKDLCGGSDILKELGQTFTLKNTTITSNKDGKDQGNSSKIIKEALIGNGNYASWVFKVNFAGDLSGTYRVLEKIPDGMELAYIRIKWTGEKQGTIQAKEIEGLEANWARKEITASTDNGRSEKTIYYVNGKQALIELGDFIAGHITGKYSVDVQVVCKVTDPNVLLGGETKTFLNQVELQTENGETLNTATAQATISTKNISKQITDKANEKITFTIQTNPLGQTLPTGNNGKIKLIDKLSDTLILDTTSMKAIVTGTNEEVKISVAIKENNTLEIEIPDDKPITISYIATVNVPPDTAASFSNEAYWENYSNTGGETVKEDGYKYHAGGSVSSGTNIKLKIIKNDTNHALEYLKDAEFEMRECVRKEDGTFSEDPNSFTWHGSTNEQGILIFGTGSSGDNSMDYNTVYKLMETKAPKGYVLDETPVYFIVPKVEDGQTEYSEYVKQCINDKNILKQYQPTFELTRSNHKGEITVEKKFIDQGGKDCSPVSGTYYFGLYDESGKQLQTTSITYQVSDMQTKSSKFVDLDLNATYYVYELDDNGNKIQNKAMGTIQGSRYIAMYSSSTNAAVNGQTFTVTNQICTPILPSTGGNGIVSYRVLGSTLLLLAGLLMINTLKKHKLEN